MNARTFALVIGALALTLPQTAAAKGFDAKLWNGKWQLDPGKSKFSSPDYTPKSDNRTYTVSGNRLTLKATTTSSTGKTMKWGYSVVADGKPYPASGNQNIDHVSIMMVSPTEFRSQGMLKGKPVSKSAASVSANELTIHRSVLNAKGGPTDDTMVFDRAK